MKTVPAVLYAIAMFALLGCQRGVDKTEACQSLAPLLDVLPQESRIYDAPETYRGCQGGSWPEVSVIYGTEDQPSRYKISLMVLDAKSPYLAEQLSDPGNSQEEGGVRLELVTTQQDENRRAEAESCADKVLNPRNKTSRPSRKTINGLDFCFDHEENNMKVSRMIWTAMAIRGDVFVKVSASGPGVQKFPDFQSAADHLEPVLQQINGNLIQ